MNKRLLYKYFRNETSSEETEEVVKWVDASEANRSTFLAKRKLWNISILHSNATLKPNVITWSYRLKHFAWQATAIAAMLLLVFNLWMRNDNPGEEKQTVIVPVGQRVNLILADGTSVWLNSNTTFTYPTSFNAEKREVEIVGEAYFEVAKKSDCPFIVTTNKHKVEVLGTTFNVYAYIDYPFETDLVEGKVKVSGSGTNIDILLNPSERVYEKNNILYKTTGGDTREYEMRKRGILAFNNEPIGNVLEMLSAYYNTRISMTRPDLQSYHCTTKFLYKDGIDYILKVLQRDLHYKIEKDTVNNTIILR